MRLSRPAADTSFALTVLGVWFAGALAFGATGALRGLKSPGPQLITASLALLAFVLMTRVSPLREWAARVDLRWFVAFHLTRFSSLYLLVLYDQGELPRAFALFGGWAESTAATLAVLLLLFVPVSIRWPDRVLAGAWNALGLVTIVGTIAAATAGFGAEPASMAPLLRLPLSLLPTFLMPLVLATHGFIFLRLRTVVPSRSLNS
ncbi:MAG: hypothetical protein AB7N65_09505 [Vicinamibacterales bacterium]